MCFEGCITTRRSRRPLMSRLGMLGLTIMTWSGLKFYSVMICGLMAIIIVVDALATGYGERRR